MKLSAISSVDASRSKQQKNSAKLQYRPNFKGTGMPLVDFWQWVDNGGRALQFTIEDMCGTNLPRTYKGAMAGYKYTGKVNIPALLQEAIREFLTGPTMCLVPIAVLSSAIKMTGKTANTHVENIENLSHLMQKTGAGDNLETRFYTTCVEDAIKNTANVAEVDEKTVESLVDGIKEYTTIKDKKLAAKKLSEISDNFTTSVKKLMDKDTFNNADFTAVKYSISDAKTGSTNFKNYIDYMTSYSSDFVKKHSNDAVKNNIDAFKKSWIGKRVLVIASMFAITGVCMSIIPKLYTLASGNRNPNAATIYDVAEGKDVKAKKGGK